MKATTRHHLFPVVLLVAFSSMVISCTKEVPYKEEFKEKVHSKSEIDTSAEYLYVPSSDLTNYDDSGAAGARPYWQGNETLIKFRFTEKTLQAVQVDDEARLKGNALNEKIVFEVPVNHVQYRCAEDRYKKCTNREEENNEISWNQKNQFKPDFDGIKTVAVNLLPIEMDQVFGESCYAETSSRFLNYELTGDALNIKVEKNFKGDMACLEKKGINITGLGDLNSQIIYHYSFTKMSTLASPGYKGLSYPVKDEGVFGFFTTNTRHYDVAYNRLEKNKIQYMNRWNPDRKEVVYYLTDNFDKPEFATIKKATQTAFDRVNAGLASAGVDFRLVLKGTAGKSPGDMRNSMIVLVEDPVAAGPLGYGPVAANPRTGEIMSARTAMYYGNLLQNIKMTYDEVVRESRRQAANSAKTKAITLALNDKPDQGAATSALGKAAANINGTLARQNNQKKAFKQMLQGFKADMQKPSANIASKYAGEKYTAKDLAKMTEREFNKIMLASDKTTKARDVLSAMSKYCNYPADLFPFNEAVKTGIQGKLGQELKLWKDLSETEKQAAIDLIAPEIWIPTLVHEIGHNLGLRHNFAGSEDKDNFYTPEELQKMGVNHEVPYSSVMDYGYSELNLLPTLGKYDIAALRFGYKREVETKDGKITKFDNGVSGKTLTQFKTENAAVELKDYSYCSDEHVEVNPNCKRFDEGTSWPQIVDFMEKSYNEMYAMRNFRNGRENFSKMSDGAYANATRARFAYVRAFAERYEGIKYKFNLTDTAKEWEEVPWLKDVKEAALKSGRFFIKVLGTPDVTCAIAEKKNPNKIVALEELQNFNKEAVSCFKDVELKPEYMVIGQAGKAFNNKKDPDSENHYADQIDVRGIFADKIVAAENLFARRTGNSLFDDYEDNYADGELFTEVMGSMYSLLMNNMTVDTTFKNALGQDIGTFKIKTRVFSAPKDQTEGSLAHWMEAPMEESIAKTLGVPMRQTSFQEVLLNIIKKHTSRSQISAANDRDQLEIFSIVKTSKAYQLSSDIKGVSLDIGPVRYVAMPENGFGTMALNSVIVAKLLEKLEQAQLEELYNEAVARQEAAEKSQAPEAIAAVPASKFGPEYQDIAAEDIVAFARGELSSELFTFLATLLPASN